MKRKNVIFIVVDAVRSYKSGCDERDRLDVYDELNNYGFVSFEKMVVSAPSSLMSSITMLTGIPSFKLGQNYNNFEWEPNLYDIVPKVLSNEGYEIFGLFGTKEMRDKMKTLFPPINSSLLAKNINTRQKKWSNQELFDTIKNYFDAGEINNQKPFFLMSWFNSRFDPKASNTIRELIEFLRAKGFLEDSLVILTADHGYPDQNRGLTSDGVDLKKAGKPHDLIVTDDNICVPFALKLPDNNSNKSQLSNLSNSSLIKKVISQECIVPTIYDVLSIIPESKKPLKYKSKTIFDELSNNFDDPIRSDARFIFQPNRITSIRTSCFKYINDRENKEEYYYDLINDPGELIKQSEIEVDSIKNLQKLYYEQEFESSQIWLKKAKEALKGSELDSMIDASDQFNVFFLGRSAFIQPFIQYLQNFNKVINLFVNDLFVESQIKNSVDCSMIKFKSFDKIQLKKGIVIIEDTEDLFWSKKLQKIKAKEILIIDIVFNYYHSKNSLVFRSRLKFIMGPFNRMYLRRELYRSDYFLFLSDLTYIFKRIFQLFFRKFFNKKKE